MPTERNDRRHWSDVYASRAADEVSWYQADPAMSLELIAASGVAASSAIIDVGGGASLLADKLTTNGFVDITVLDVSAVALAAAKQHLGSRAGQVTWVEADLLHWRPGRRYDLWHDRAVFHFLTDQADRNRYVATLRSAIKPAGCVVIGAFAADGPDHCSGLPTSRYDADSLAAEFAGFDRTVARREEHHTPAGVMQPFTWLLLRNAT